MQPELKEKGVLIAPALKKKMVDVSFFRFVSFPQARNKIYQIDHDRMTFKATQ